MPRRVGFAFLVIVVLVVLVFLVLQLTGPNPNALVVIDANDVGEAAVEISEATSQNVTDMISDFIQRLNSVPQSDLVRVLMVIGGAILLFAGWRVYNWIIILAGFLIGGSLATALVGNPDTVINIIVFLVGALIGAAVAYFLYYVAVFFIGAYVAVIFATMLSNSFGWGPIPYWLLLIIVIIGGIAMLGLSYELLVVLASVLGALLVVNALGLAPASFWILGLALIGIIVQVGFTRYYGYGVRRRYSRRRSLI
jgi:hypothetical protein